MKKNSLKRTMIVMLSVLLALVPAFSAIAETARETSKEGGRVIIVQEVKLEDENASAMISRGETFFAPAAGVRLAQGDVITTKGKAVLYLSVDSQMVLRLDNNTEAVIEKATFGQKLVVNVKNGHMFYNVAKQESGAESLEMMSNNIIIAVRGTAGELGSEFGIAQHQLYDGVVEVAYGGVTMQQTPGQMLEVAASPGGALAENLTVKNFTLADIPKSLVEEMKKDENLMGRILQSVPLSTGVDGTPVYADAETFLATITGKDDDEVFSGTSRQNVKEAEQEAYEVRRQQWEDERDDPDPGPDPTPTTCPYADGSKGGELYYIREVVEDGYYKTFSFRYNSSTGKFEYRGNGGFSTSETHKAGEWVHYHIMDGFVGVCTQNGDSAKIPGMCTVTFDMNGQTVKDPPEAQEIEEGGTAYNPGSYFEVTGYDLDGWYKESECKNKWDFANDTVTEDITLYAHWAPKTMGICFDLGGGTDGPEPFDLVYGEDFPTLDPPVWEEGSFTGFFSPDNEKIVNRDGSPVEGAADLLWTAGYSSVTLYAEWN